MLLASSSLHKILRYLEIIKLTNKKAHFSDGLFLLVLLLVKLHFLNYLLIHFLNYLLILLSFSARPGWPLAPWQSRRTRDGCIWRGTHCRRVQ